ncbi:glycosyltransferase family 4 protein [Marivirga sp. S37H4]|uniref:Glycosyltransferase family 4 protein n=1 Tax=Marivirga aurantiaca TaxID=2802615 RepID=A0A934X2D7_9BACT|nr:glycosyltransferase family 4 protein [Marivirga aurantiaca]MBK6267187.1 glycosyltransferase family 4 protein [Marivirga aurantiaca]
MKILVISNYRTTVTARPEAEIFIGLQEKGHEVTIMTYGDADYNKKFKEKGLKVIPFHPTKKRDKESIAFIREELIRGKYDILQMFNSLAYFNGIPAAKGLPVKVVLYRGYTGNIAWYDPFMYLKYFNSRVDGVVCLVEAIRKLFVKNAPWAKQKFRTINKGHDIGWYKIDKEFDLSPFGVKKDDVSFICAANDRKMKGVVHLLKATHYLDENTPMHLFLAGNGMGKPEFQKLIDESPLKKNIHLLGFRDNILEIVKDCDVFVLASLYGEAITKAVIEAMSLGKAPLITDIPGNVNLVISGESGIVVPPANAKALAEGMKTYISNRELIRKYGKAAQDRIQTVYHTSKTVKEFEEFYNELLG